MVMPDNASITAPSMVCHLVLSRFISLRVNHLLFSGEKNMDKKEGRRVRINSLNEPKDIPVGFVLTVTRRSD
jgi:hypothetical protein